MGDIYDIRNDLEMSMTMAAFTGISWYIGAEINTSLFLLFKRRRGLYFWSCALASWGVVLQPLFIILADFGVWTNLKGSITMIYLTWLIMVVPQSWLLYSRLHLIMQHDNMLRWLKIVLAFNSVVFAVPTVVIGILAQATVLGSQLFRINIIWDRVQLTVFFVQETVLSIIYIRQTRKYLRDSSPLDAPYASSRSVSETKQVLQHLIYTNILIIFLDIALLGIQYADLFYLQGALKPCIYGIKLKVEFAILNRLIELTRRRSSGESTNEQSKASDVLGAARATSGMEVSWSRQSQSKLDPKSPGEKVGFERLDVSSRATSHIQRQAPDLD